jgi:hypothetical protein
VLHRSKVTRVLAGAALLAAAACHGGPGAMPAVPSQPGTAFASSGQPEVKAAIKLSVKSLAFTAVGAASAKSVTATETGYKGKFKATTTCGASVTVAPASKKGPTAVFKVTPVSSASCVLTVSDTAKHKATARISVTLPALNISPATLNFDATGASYASTFTVTQTGTGAFTEKDTCASIAAVTPAAWKAPSATVTVTPSAAGTCTITITDAYGQSKPVAISVTTSTIGIQ